MRLSKLLTISVHNFYEFFCLFPVKHFITLKICFIFIIAQQEIQNIVYKEREAASKKFENQ